MTEMRSRVAVRESKGTGTADGIEEKKDNVVC
jgi:hypothetical protein